MNGSCSFHPSNGYKCNCEQGWIGKNCDFDCTSHPNRKMFDKTCYTFMKEKLDYDSAAQSCNNQG